MKDTKAGGFRCTVASNVITCLLVALLANQQQLADTPAYVQKLFQLTVSEADGQGLCGSLAAQSSHKMSCKAAF
jgi:fluoride ion exporter CrcB/FEX